jgi:hypothetical protein
MKVVVLKVHNCGSLEKSKSWLRFISTVLVVLKGINELALQLPGPTFFGNAPHLWAFTHS